jgi:hypothetical protein
MDEGFIELFRFPGLIQDSKEIRRYSHGLEATGMGNIHTDPLFHAKDHPPIVLRGPYVMLQDQRFPVKRLDAGVDTDFLVISTGLEILARGLL